MEPDEVIGAAIWSGVAALANGDNRVVIKPQDFIFLRQYARFPQGLPPHFKFR